MAPRRPGRGRGSPEELRAASGERPHLRQTGAIPTRPQDAERELHGNSPSPSTPAVLARDGKARRRPRPQPVRRRSLMTQASFPSTFTGARIARRCDDANDEHPLDDGGHVVAAGRYVCHCGGGR